MEELIALLKAGDVDAFNDQRPRRGKLDLFAADLAEIKAPGADLATAVLDKADLTDAVLTDAILARASMSGADISDADLSGIMALQSRWREAWIEDTDFTDADLSAADLSDATLTRVKMPRAVLAGAKLKRVTLSESDLSGVDLTDARMAEADVSGCDLSGAAMSEVRLNEAKLVGTNLQGADLTRGRLGGADLTDADLRGATLVEADLSGATLTGAQMAGADFSRADLSGVDLGALDLEGVTLTDAQVPPEHLHLAVGRPPPLSLRIIEEPQVAGSGSHVAVLWENPEPPPSRSWLRLGVGKLDADAPDDAPALPIPADLAIARTVAGTPDGFEALVLLERPGGTVALVTPISKRGKLGTPRRLELGYTPAARPVLRRDDDTLVLYGIAREGPGLVAHRLDDDGLTALHGQAMRTVRGFVSDHHPVVLSKGGTLVQIGPRGVGAPMSAPSDFPGRRNAAAPLEDGLALVWAPSARKGLRLAVVGRRNDEVDRHLMPKKAIGLVDAATVGGESWAVFTREPMEAGEAATAWAVLLPDGEPIQITDSAEHDVSELRMVTGGDKPLVAVVDLDGSLSIFELRASGAKRRWRVG